MSYSTSSWVPMYVILFFFILLCPTAASNWNYVFAVFLFFRSFDFIWLGYGWFVQSDFCFCTVCSIVSIIIPFIVFCVARIGCFLFFIFLLNIHVFWGCWLKLPLGWCCGLLLFWLWFSGCHSHLRLCLYRSILLPSLLCWLWSIGHIEFWYWDEAVIFYDSL